MAIAFCPGYSREPCGTLVADYLGREVHPLKNFRVECGPIFPSRAIGRDGPRPPYPAGSGATRGVCAARILEGTAGKRVCCFLGRPGFMRSYDQHLSRAGYAESRVR
jgi:hypothetical protein